jgi:hypothetical protein
MIDPTTPRLARALHEQNTSEADEKRQRREEREERDREDAQAASITEMITTLARAAAQLRIYESEHRRKAKMIQQFEQGRADDAFLAETEATICQHWAKACEDAIAHARKAGLK